MNRYEIKRNDSVFRFFAIVVPKNKQFATDKYYYSYVPDTIIVTRSASSGKIMHGPFTAYYPNKNLMEQGFFEYGLKSGEWKTWFPTGQLKYIESWKAGNRFGKYEKFDTNGRKVVSGVYKKGLYKAYVIDSSKNGPAIIFSDKEMTQPSRDSSHLPVKANE